MKRKVWNVYIQCLGLKCYIYIYIDVFDVKMWGNWFKDVEMMKSIKLWNENGNEYMCVVMAQCGIYICDVVLSCV